MWVQPGSQALSAPMLNEDHPLIVNAIGHVAGAIVFGMFLVLALRRSSGRRSRQSILPVASAGLAWVWNVGALALLWLPPGPGRWAVEAVSFCSLSLLPAVLLHLSLHKRLRGIAIAGYLLSGAATAMHLSEGIQPGLPLHKSALWLITFGFGALTVIYAAALLREGREAKGRTPQILASMCLLLFAVTVSHFGSGHPPQLWKEVLVHHAGIPIALLILLQDYRFVFLDAFVRFLANVLLAVFLSYAGIRLAANLVPENGTERPLADLIAVAGLCGLLILFAYLRGIVQRLLTRALFRSGSIETIVHELRSGASEIRKEGDYLKWIAQRLAAFAGTTVFEMLAPEARAGCPDPPVRDLDYPVPADDEPWLSRDPRWDWAEVIVPVRLSQQDVRYLLLGRRRGGRPYLSEDLRSLNDLSRVVAEEVERFRAAEMKRLVSEAELRALHSQINPHFLFNALNTIYGIIPREAAGARRTVLNLADIFRYFLQSDKILIPLSKELEIVRAYLEIEHLRLGPRLQTMIQVDKDAEQTLIPVLSVQPLVENAIKHGLAPRTDEGWLRVSAHVADGAMNIVVEDSGSTPTGDAPEVHSSGAGVGLANVSRRLQLCFGGDANVKMERSVFGTRVQFSVPVSQLSEHETRTASRDR
jgi:two-component system LytT family sensor kinase